MANASALFGGRIKKIYQGVISITGTGTTHPATLSPAVDTNKSILFHLGGRGASSADADITLVLTNSTTVTATRSGPSGAGAVSYQVVEYY